MSNVQAQIRVTYCGVAGFRSVFRREVFVANLSLIICKFVNDI